LRKGQLTVANPVNLCYGYPIFIDSEDYCSPLFYIAVEATAMARNRWKIRVPDPSAVRLNHHHFRKLRLSVEELQEVQEQLEGPYGSFPARLNAALEILGNETTFDIGAGMQAFPKPGGAVDRWLNRGILFRNERSVYTANLRRELDALSKYRRLQLDVANTALGALLEPMAARNTAEKLLVCQIVPLNDAQIAAASAALSQRITVITGPPGTGKSQVIVDILATCARDGTGVLFASKNNKAVDVVSERLNRILGLDDWSLRLGNRDYVDKARERLRVRLSNEVSPRANNTGVSTRDVTRVIEALERRRQRVIETVDRYRDAASLRRRFECLTPVAWKEQEPPSSLEELRRLFAQTYFDALVLTGREPGSFWFRIERLFAPFRQRQRLNARVGAIVDILGAQHAFNLVGSDNLESICDFLTNVKCYLGWLGAIDEERACRIQMEEGEPLGPLEAEIRKAREALSEASICELAKGWTERIRPRAARLNENVTRYFSEQEAMRSGQARGGEFLGILDEAVARLSALTKLLPVWIVTSLSARRGIPLAPAIFDLVVIDEASQCDIASAIPLLFRAKRAVIIGDPKQLRHISTLDPRVEMNIRDDVGTREFWTKGWSYVDRSLYELAELVENGQDRRAYFLDEHYRSDGDVIEFSNRAFYGGRLVVRTNRDNLLRTGFEPGIFWHDLRGSVPPGARSACNPDESAAIVKLIESWAARLRANRHVTIGIVTPFRRQMEVLETAILESEILADAHERIRIGTAHRFQGDECDVLVFSTVIASGMPQRLISWVARTDQLLNVSITRARAALHIVGDLAAAKGAGGRLAELAFHVTDVTSDEHVPETEEERQVALVLGSLGLHYRPQVRIGKYRVDFEVISPFGTRWVIEIDGAQHLAADSLDRDAARDSFLTDAGYHVLRISNRSVRTESESVRAILERLY